MGSQSQTQLSDLTRCEKYFQKQRTCVAEFPPESFFLQYFTHEFLTSLEKKKNSLGQNTSRLRLLNSIFFY